MNNIELLIPENYAIWSVDIEVLLWDHGCCEFNDGLEIPPDDSAKFKQKRDYNLRLDRAFSCIHLNVSPDL